MNVSPLVAKLLSRRWAEPNSALKDESLRYPGVYVLAFSGKPLSDHRIDPKDVFYVGMSNSKGGVRQRIKQFLDGIEKCDFHSGAMRFFRDYAGGKPFSKLHTRKRFYAAAVTIPCNTIRGSRTPSDLRNMGHVTCLEYYVRARLQHRLGRQPELNRQ